ncbi:MAG: hypothetical protein AB4368_10050 [Xenococcaceae cyanobacterium]
MNTSTELARILAQCRLACGAEAVARGFPPEAGYDMYYGCCADALQARSESQFLYWTYRLDSKYGCDSTVTLNPLMEQNPSLLPDSEELPPSTQEIR